MAKYPLEPLARIREAEVDEASHTFAAAVRARLEAASRLAESEAAEARFLEVAAEVARRESLAFASGVLRAGDLEQNAVFEVGVSIEHETYRNAVRSAEAALAEASANEERARALVAEKKAQAEAVERARAKFVAKERRVADANEDEAAEEAIRGRS